MPVFNADIQTPLAVPDPGTDSMLPPPGALSYGSITQQSALAGTNGVDTLLVAGDRDRQMNGNEHTRVTQDRTHTVGGDQTKQIAGNKTENVIGNFAQTTMSNLSRTIIGATNDLHTGIHTIAHKANQLLQEPEQYMHEVKDKMHKAHTEVDAFTYYTFITRTASNFVTLNMDFKGAQTALIVAAAEKALVSVDDYLAKIADKKTEAHFTDLEAKIGAIQPVVNITYLHEVAFTQKIIVIGANQIV